MKEGVAAIGALVMAWASLALLVLVGCILGTATGAFGGWVVGKVFPNTFRLWLSIFCLPAEPWQVGAMLGFVGGFLRSHLRTSKT